MVLPKITGAKNPTGTISQGLQMNDMEKEGLKGAATGAAKGACLGFLKGGPVGAKIGAVKGAASGAGMAMANHVAERHCSNAGQAQEQEQSTGPAMRR